MYYFKPMLIRPSKNVLFYIIYNEHCEFIARVDKKEDAEKLISLLNAKVYSRSPDKIA